MIKKLLKGVLENAGYEVKKNKYGVTADKNGVLQYAYQKPDGTFDYEHYKQIQEEGNKKKIDNIWVQEENIAFLSKYIQENVANLKFGLCHGTRRGKEQEWFRKHLDVEVTGTEISETATQFPHTIQWDFHEVKDEWKENVDFIYSNSFDHSYDPKKCINAWMSCIKKGGMCILEHSSGHEKSTQLDPFGAHLSSMPYLILDWSEGKFCVTQILDAPVKDESLSYLKYLVIQKV